MRRDWSRFTRPSCSHGAMIIRAGSVHCWLAQQCEHVPSQAQSHHCAAPKFTKAHCTLWMCLCWLQKNRWYPMRHEACWNKAAVNVLWARLREFRKYVMCCSGLDLAGAWKPDFLFHSFVEHFYYCISSFPLLILILDKMLTQILWRIICFTCLLSIKAHISSNSDLLWY